MTTFAVQFPFSIVELVPLYNTIRYDS